MVRRDEMRWDGLLHAGHGKGKGKVEGKGKGKSRGYDG